MKKEEESRNCLMKRRLLGDLRVGDTVIGYDLKTGQIELLDVFQSIPVDRASCRKVRIGNEYYTLPGDTSNIYRGTTEIWMDIREFLKKRKDWYTDDPVRIIKKLMEENSHGDTV